MVSKTPMDLNWHQFLLSVALNLQAFQTLKMNTITIGWD